MAQSAAQPILDYRDKLIDFAQKFEDWGKSGSKTPKPDTAWHDEMVKKANESFRKASEKTFVKKPAQSAVIRKKPTTSKSYPKKRMAKKR